MTLDLSTAYSRRGSGGGRCRGNQARPQHEVTRGGSEVSLWELDTGSLSGWLPCPVSCPGALLDALTAAGSPFTFLKPFFPYCNAWWLTGSKLANFPSLFISSAFENDLFSAVIQSWKSIDIESPAQVFSAQLRVNTQWTGPVCSCRSSVQLLPPWVRLLCSCLLTGALHARPF